MSNDNKWFSNTAPLAAFDCVPAEIYYPGEGLTPIVGAPYVPPPIDEGESARDMGLSAVPPAEHGELLPAWFAEAQDEGKK